MSRLKKLEKLLTEGKISRRDFIAYASAVGLSAAISPALMPTPAKAASPRRAPQTLTE